MPLEIQEIRAGMSPLRFQPTKRAFLPGDKGKIEVKLNTGAFLGERTFAIYLTCKAGGNLNEARLLVRGHSQETEEKSEMIT